MHLPAAVVLFCVAGAVGGASLVNYDRYCLPNCACCGAPDCRDCATVCPPFCTCKYDNKNFYLDIVVCNEMGMCGLVSIWAHCVHTTVSDGAPADMPSLTTDLTISNSNITHLPSLWLLGRKRLQTLRLHNNNMRRIDDNAFKHMMSLRLVDLRANDLQLDTLTGE